MYWCDGALAGVALYPHLPSPVPMRAATPGRGVPFSTRTVTVVGVVAGLYGRFFVGCLGSSDSGCTTFHGCSNWLTARWMSAVLSVTIEAAPAVPVWAFRRTLTSRG